MSINKTNQFPVKPIDKESLVVCRPMLLRILDVEEILIPELRGKVFSDTECSKILQDPRRRIKTTKVHNGNR